MCGRYVLYEELDEIDHFLGVMERHGEYHPSYNIAPSNVMPVAFTGEDGRRMLESMHWGFMGWQPKPGDSPFLPINTRDDSVAKKPMWTKAFAERRCIIPANGFYEWTGTKGNKTPYYIYPKGEPLFGFAGLYSDLAPDNRPARRSYSIITTSPNKVMEKIHDRMPVILHPSEFDQWLDPEQHDPKYLQEFLEPYPDDGLEEHIVPKAVGNVRNNEPGLIAKADLFG